MKRSIIITCVVTVLFIATYTLCVGMEAENKTFTSPSLGARFVLIPAGTFMMGDVAQRRVVITKPFYMQTTEVTRKQWQSVMGDDPSLFKHCGIDCPVENVSWVDVQAFIRRLNQKEGTNKYRLPTEAEWEYACRAGAMGKYSFGDNENELGDYAWYNKNSGRRTHPVAGKKPNAWGLYDMHGNIWEWCHDWYDDYPAGAVTDPKGPASGQHKVFRGGSWTDSAVTLQSSFRGQDYPIVKCNDIGVRLARTF